MLLHPPGQRNIVILCPTTWKDVRKDIRRPLTSQSKSPENRLVVGYLQEQWRAEGGAGGAMAPGIQPGGIQGGSFFKVQVKGENKEKKGDGPGHPG